MWRYSITFRGASQGAWALRGQSPSGGSPFFSKKGDGKKDRGRHGPFQGPIRRPLDPGNVRAAVWVMLVGKTRKPLQLVLVWRWNDSGCRPSAYDLVRLDSSCVFLSANKPPQGSAPLVPRRVGFSTCGEAVAPVGVTDGALCWRLRACRPIRHGLCPCHLPYEWRRLRCGETGGNALALPGIAKPGAPRQRMGVNECGVGRNGRGGS